MGKTASKPAEPATVLIEETVSGARRVSFALLQANLAVALVALARWPNDPKPATLIDRADEAAQAVVRAANDPAYAADDAQPHAGLSADALDEALTDFAKRAGEIVDAAVKEQTKLVEERLAALDKALTDHAAASVQLADRLGKVEAMLEGVTAQGEVLGRLMSLHERLELVEQASTVLTAHTQADETAADKG